MGFFSFLKRKFAKGIEVRVDMSNQLVFVFKPKKGKVWLGRPLKVEQGQTFVFAHKGKVLDVFGAGEIELKAVFIPKCVRKFKLDKQTKRGDFPQFFKPDCYFVNHKLFDYEKWRGFRKIEIFDPKLGYLKARLSGGYAFSVKDAEKFIAALLTQYDYLLQDEALELLDGFIVDFVLREIDKQNLDYEGLISIDKLTDEIFEKMEKQFEKIGIEIAGFSLEQVKFSKRQTKIIKQHKSLELINENLDNLEEV